jgi:group I intron endonuclease
MNIYTIYKAVNEINGKCYIGFTVNFHRRKNAHLNRSFNLKNKNYHCKLYRAIRKYGWDNFEWEIIYQSLDGEHCLNVMESYFIEFYDSFNNGYNMTLGGEGILGRKGNLCWLYGKIGKNHPCYGKKRPDASKKMHDWLISEQGRKFSSEFHSKHWLLTTPDGCSFCVKNLKIFCNDKNFYNRLWNLAKGRIKYSQGWKCEEIIIK